MLGNRYRGYGDDEDEQFERAKRRLLREIEWNEFVESLSPEERQRKRNRGVTLVEEGKRAARSGSYSEAVGLLREAYQADQDGDTLYILIDTHIAWADNLLSVGQWRQAKQKLVSLRREGLVISKLYYMLARISYVAFENEGSITAQYLREALKEIQEAITQEPLNPQYHLEAARINATYAHWWKSAPEGTKRVQEYLRNAIKHMETAFVAAEADRALHQELQNVVSIISQVGDPTEILPVSLLQTLRL